MQKWRVNIGHAGLDMKDGLPACGRHPAFSRVQFPSINAYRYTDYLADVGLSWKEVKTVVLIAEILNHLQSHVRGKVSPSKF